MAPRTMRSRSLLLLVPSLLLALVGTAGPARAHVVGCGAVLTQDTTLGADLLDCQGDGLVIGADNITVDLGGHVVDGIFPNGGVTGQVGIANRAGHDGVTVRDGTVREFGRGVELDRADRNQVLDLQVASLDEYGILLQGGSGNRFAGNSVTSPGDVGIAVYGATGGPSRDNVVTGNRVEAPDIVGVAVEHRVVTGTTIEGNELLESQGAGHGGGVVVGQEPGTITGTRVRGNRLRDNSGGVLVGSSATDTVVERNDLLDNYAASIYTDGDRTLVRTNTVTSSWTGRYAEWGVQVDTDASGTRVEANTLSRLAYLGVDDSGRDTLITLNLIDGQIDPTTWTGIFGGIAVRPEARRTRVLGNLVRRLIGGGEVLGAGINVAGDDVTVAGNEVAETHSPGADGIRVTPEAARVLVAGNRASRNPDDGIDVDSPATTVTANVANDNGDYGIEAPGVTDGGGNRASGNGNPAQCLGVVCA